MRVGVALPQREIGNDPEAIRSHAQAVERLGFDHLVVFDRAISANVPGESRSRAPFHEPFVVLAFIAACVRELELATAVTVLPLRQTVVVARQAAELDVLTRGRLRLGVGIGRNEHEYAAYGQNFKDRGQRIEEQIAVLRALFTEELVDYTGKTHRLDLVGINPRPVQRPIPIWMGGTAPVSARRVARIADGWFTQASANDQGKAQIETFRSYLRRARREPADFPIEGRINAGEGTAADWARSARWFKEERLTHVYFSTMDVDVSGRSHRAAARVSRELAVVRLTRALVYRVIRSQ